MSSLVKKLIRRALAWTGYEVTKVRGHCFTVEGIEYLTDRCSTGRTPEGEHAAAGAVRLIQERGLRELSVLDVCCGVGTIGLTIWSQLRQEPDVIRRLTFADINVFNMLSLRRTLRHNRIDEAMGDRVRCYLSDGLRHIPDTHKFDLIISNPPHYADGDDNAWMSAGRLSTVDVGWSFHREFYEQVHQYLNPSGQVWLFENRHASRIEDSVSLIRANQRLVLSEVRPEPGATRFHWVISQRTTGLSVESSAAVG